MINSKIALFLSVALCGCAPAPQFFNFGGEYLGVKYINDPLGEGAGVDADPLIRFDAFDCTTFVETVLAGGDVEKLNKIRYRDGVPNFLARNHFVETDWLANNSDIVENVSGQYAPTTLRRVLIDRRAWFKRKHNIDTDFAPQWATIEYIPYSQVSNIRITRPMIVLFIADKSEKRVRMSGTDLAVRHMGFLMPNGTLRHASLSAGRVVDVDFRDYIATHSAAKNNLGIALVEIK